jgi:hypothetical protein
MDEEAQGEEDADGQQATGIQGGFNKENVCADAGEGKGARDRVGISDVHVCVCAWLSMCLSMGMCACACLINGRNASISPALQTLLTKSGPLFAVTCVMLIPSSHTHRQILASLQH